MDGTVSRHHLFDPEGLPPARGFSYGAVAAPGRALYLAGVTAEQVDGGFPDGIVAQFAEACRRVERIVREAGGEPSDVVSMTIYTISVDDYKANLEGIGAAWREVFGRHYPPIALIGVAELFEPGALVELVCVAVVPDAQPG